ncbi:SusC/RagA family TonB-linked outer membrane protein [Chitinophaga nivalis]|uniref:SusC/RagA family TonB-linked outer membrane protein n=1 Tax=Chitinophaga nivalis TaxID=2991709 RepID=A0ABT3II15_9BACT|nr:SusC/RagA family TonB-linked outer membrane protein [Chitinophaga nivalis]MCW3466707.1 SusC/RagA family TonB-linked outer membrane protein [Chitinophaga nivalis]MCW3483602.1 SusC/RagA family TonB-linked outer membrane protein [Chitinophaga nivalis]
MQTKLLMQNKVVGLLLCLVTAAPHALAAQSAIANSSFLQNTREIYELEDVFPRLESIRKVKFNYNSEILRGKTVNAALLKKMEQADITTALPLLLRSLGLTCEPIQGNYYAIKPLPATTMHAAATHTVQGVVTDAGDNNLLPGVVITVKGKAKGTNTDATGKYTLAGISPDDILRFSLLGYKPLEIPVNGRKELNISLQADVAGLSEVVVTALGIQKEKKSLGYAVQSVKGESMTQAREPNLVSSLTGRVAGLVIRNSTDMFRDAAILLRGTKPLIVIDGIPDQTADMWKINPDDVESINVLKGTSASALYGSIGQFGALMITTKRGKGKELTVDFNSSTMFQPSFIRIPQVQTTYGSGNKGKYAYIDGSGSGPEGSGWIWGPKLDQQDPTTPSGYWETPQYNSPIDPVTGKPQPLPWLSRGKKNVRNFFRTGVISTNSLSVVQASDKGSFRASANHIYQQGIVPNTQLNNSSFSIAGNYNLTDRLNVDARFTYNRQYTDNYPTVGYGPGNYLYNLVLWTGSDVDIRDLRNYWVPGKEGIQQRHYNTSWYNNPYFQAYELLTGYYKNNTFGSMTLDYKINQDFSVKLRTGTNTYGLSTNTKEPVSYIGYSNKSRGNYSVGAQNYFDIVTDLIARYQHTFSKNFSIHAEAGGSNYYRNHRYQESFTDGLTIPQFYNLSNSANPIQGINFLEERRTSSVYGFVDMEFLGALYLSVTGRTDKISTLPIANNRFFYPSTSVSVVISELVKMPAWISYLKARGSWSQVSSGQLDKGDPYTYKHLQTFDKGIKWGATPSLTISDILKNPLLNPQTSNAWEAGVETKLFDNRLGFDVTYFRVRDFDNIVQIPSSLASGYSQHMENGNAYLRTGWEFMLTATPVRTDHFRWDVMANFSTYKRILKDIYNNAKQLEKIRPGERMDRIFASVYETDREGNIVYEPNGFPKRDVFNRFIGNEDPDWTYGIENTLRYKQVSFRFLVDGRIGGLMYSSTNQKMWWGGTHPGTVNQYRDDANAGKNTYVGQGVVVTSGSIQYDADGNVISDTRQFAPNTKAVNYIDYMINTSNAANNNYNYYSQTFLKLREVDITWQLPRKWLNKTFFRSAAVSLVGRNLLLFSKLPNVDPDAGSDNLQTPSTRSMGFNVNLKF